jgi:DNA-binding transcriptional LysR family regulator
MHITQIDLNLLKVAAAIYKTRNVSKAASDLGVSQSAVSHALSRLRTQFQDPMFVRTAKGIAPTEFARSIQGELLDVVLRVELLANRKEKFDPKEVKSRITLSTTDLVELVLMGGLQKKLAVEAPNLQVSIRPAMGELPRRELEDGKVDLAVAGFFKDLPEGFYQAKLFSDVFACATRRDHPLKKLGVQEYFDANHALITLQGDFRDGIQHGSGKKKRVRHISYGSSSFTSLAWILQETDLILTGPSLLLKKYSQFFPTKIWPCPIDLGDINIQMVWHAQTHEDPLRIWFREKLRSQCPAIK